MEFSPEIAVVQSAFNLVNNKQRDDNRKPFCEYVKVVVPSILEVINGVEARRSELDRQFWRFKIFSLLLKKVTQTKDENHHESAVKYDDLQHPLNSVDQICQQLPPIPPEYFFEIVKKIDSFDLLSQGLCILNPAISHQLVTCLLDHATTSPVDSNDAHLISAALDYVISQWISNTAVPCPTEHDAIKTDMGTISSWLKQIFIFLTNHFGKELNITSDLNFVINILEQFMLCGILSATTEESREKVNLFMKRALERREITDDKHGTFTTFCTFFKKLTSKSTEIDLHLLPVSFPFPEYLKVFNNLCVIIKELLKSLLDTHDFKDKIMILSDQVFTFSLEPVLSCFCALIENGDFGKLYEQAEGPDLRQTVDVIVETVHQLLNSLQEMKLKRISEDEEDHSKFALEDILKLQLSGCEEMLAKVLMDCDLEWWSKDGVSQHLLNNTELLCDMNQIKQMRNLIKQCRTQHPEKTTAITNIRKVLLAAFSSLPTVVQEEIIVENYLTEPKPAYISTVETFHKDVNVIFNKFTSNSDNKLLLSVLGLALQDPVHVIEKSVETAVTNSGQIPVVCKILQTLVELCRCRHPVLHPDQSLLTQTLNSFLLSENLGVTEKKNVISLVCSAVQRFELQICESSLQEAPVLQPAEFISITVIPFIGVENMYMLNQTMTVAFSLEILTSVIETVGGDETTDLLDPCPLLLCLCALLHECVLLSDDPDKFVTKVTVKQRCTACWTSMDEMFKKRNSVLTDLEVDWLLTRVKSFDWTVLLRLQMTFHLIQGHKLEDLILDDITRNLTSDESYVSLFRFVSISDHHLRIISPAGPAIGETITFSLLQVLANVTVDEAKHVCVCAKSLLSTDNTYLSFHLFFQDTISLCDFHGMKGVLYLSQVLMDMFILAVQSADKFPPVVLRHMITCYVSVMRKEDDKLQQYMGWVDVVTDDHGVAKDRTILTSARDTFYLVGSLFKTIAMYVSAAKDALSFVIDTNYQIVSFIFYYVSSFFAGVFGVARIIYTIVLTILHSCYEFIFEFVACLYAIALFIWNIFLLIYKILCFLISGAETVVVCLWTGTYTTVTTLKQSATNAVNSCCSIWNCGVEFSQDLINSIIGGFSMIGNVGLCIVRTVWWSLGFTFASVLNLLCNCYGHIYNMWNKLVSAATSTFTLSQEVYLGVIICCIIYLVVSNLILFVRSNGIPFKFLWHRSRTRVRRPQYDFDHDFESDVEIIDNDEAEEEVLSDDSRSVTDNSDETGSEDEISEDDDDSDGSVNSQTFSSESDHEIEISLPELSTERYTLRSRSSTPARLKNLSSEDFVYEIEKEKDKRKCVVCQDHNKCVLVLPCRHMCLCVECANHIVRARYAVRRVCPLCRQQIEKVMNVYV